MLCTSAQTTECLPCAADDVMVERLLQFGADLHPRSKKLVAIPKKTAHLQLQNDSTHSPLSFPLPRSNLNPPVSGLLLVSAHGQISEKQRQTLEELIRGPYAGQCSPYECSANTSAHYFAAVSSLPAEAMAANAMDTLQVKPPDTRLRLSLWTLLPPLPTKNFNAVRRLLCESRLRLNV
jgi:hypothetical protein